MAAKPFLDTNVLIYAFSDTDIRQAQATSLITFGGTVSVQILNEFANVAQRKLGKPWSAIVIALNDTLELLDPPLPVTIETHRRALDISRRYGFGIYDSLVLSAAKGANCRVLYTEDLQHGQEIDGVLVQNPFLNEPGSSR